MDIYVSRSKFKEMTLKISCQSIAEKGVAEGVRLGNKNYVITGSITGNGGYISVWGYEIVPPSLYRSSLRPLTYSEHNRAVGEGERKSGYDGMLIKVDGKKMVMVGESITFDPIKESTQLALF
ncbi:MAG: hypothetical protein LBQ58_10640 [Synergistaceae bacterium]|jgi:hypothetical protein|nr:hypothetical protein [Synergistaceae bacterium]